MGSLVVLAGCVSVVFSQGQPTEDPFVLSARPPLPDEVVVYYDYVEGGRLQGGRLLVKRDHPEVQAALGFGQRQALGAPPDWAVTTLVDNGAPANRIDLVILGDGYTAGELDTYDEHVTGVLTPFFAEEPLAAYAGYFNIYRVDVISNESGVDEPVAGIFRDTALDMTYDCLGIDRLLCVDTGKALDAASLAPEVDQILGLANSDRYGGAGYPGQNLGTVAGDNFAAVEVALHEFGHSFADLADEYDYGDGATFEGPEPIETNVSTLLEAVMANMETKWHLWLDDAGIGTFEGAMYHEFDIYRPTNDSKMRSLNRPFDPINVEQFVLFLYMDVDPIDAATPSGSVLPDGTEFFVTPMVPTDHALDIQWFLDGGPVAGAEGPTYVPDYGTLSPGLHDVSVTVVDNTDRVRDEVARTMWMTATRQWQLQTDCNNNGTADGLDIAGGGSSDCNLNGSPDECEPPADCNSNTIQDICELFDGSATDCDTNGTLDQCDLDGGAAQDCNANGVLDSCDLAAGSENDCNNNAVPDVCEDVGINLTSQPVSQEVEAGGSAVFSVTAGGLFLQYRWRLDGQDLSDDADISGSGTPTLTLTNVVGSSSGAYDCRVTNGLGCFVLSDQAILTVTGGCPADLTGNGIVDAGDLAQLLGAWGPNPGHPGDLTGDGNVNAADLAQLLGAWARANDVTGRTRFLGVPRMAAGYDERV